MRNALFVFGLLLCAAALSASDPVTVASLEQQISALHSKSDEDAARSIDRLKLTERLTTERLHVLQSALPGEKSRLALLAIADAYAFLDLPRSDYGMLVAPDEPTQGRILTSAAEFVSRTMPRMPNFLATRDITRWESTIPAHQVFEGVAPPVAPDFPPFRLLNRSQSPVTYRDGKEVVGTPDKAPAKKARGLTSWGEFGPLLQIAMLDILQGKVGWDYWEKTSDGLIAVFQYQVSKRPHYVVRYCCVPSKGKSGDIELTPPYHGEIAIDPKTGHILRLVIQTKLRGNLIQRADVAVEYGPVNIGGSTYTCPLRSISLSTAADMNFNMGVGSADLSSATLGNSTYMLLPGQATAINDVAFVNYHMFRAEMRILPEGAGTPPQTPQP
jgi:hypothetical protein